MRMIRLLLWSSLAAASAAGAQESSEIKQGVQRHLSTVFLFMKVDGMPHAFSGSAQKIQASSCVYGDIYQYGAYTWNYTSSELTPADKANGVLWKGDVFMHATPYRKIHYNTRECGSSAFDPDWKKPCWSEWRDIPENMKFVWKLVLKKSGWEPRPFRLDHSDWRIAGGAPISHEVPLSVSGANAILSYSSCQ